ncbi:MAG: BMP family ABC transporter substrate-binding protein [Fastidiosipila sp.]|nr:BMP family ABC transporter substrate-binding protein [Fastidiosipila sp.]
MKKLKTILALMLALLMAVSVIACDNGEEPTTTEPDNGTGVTEPEEPTEKPEEEPSGALHVGILTTSGVDDGSFGQACYEGILEYVDANEGASVNDVKEDDIGRVVQAVADIIADYDAMVMPGFQFAPVGPVVADNPDTYFILVDSYPTIDDEEVELDNIYAMMFKEEESGFFAGISAALETKTDKVAVVNGIAFPSNVNYQFGFMSGVHYANEHFGTSAEIVELPAYAGVDVTGEDVGGNYAGDFADQARGKLIGEALLAEGVDIIFVAAGDTGNGVFAAVKEASVGNYVIGCDVDQYDDGATGDRNIVLTSALKNMTPIVAEQLQKAHDGTFEGQNALLGAAEGGTGYVSDEGRQQLSEDTLQKLEEVFALIEDGTIVPASNFNGHSPDDFPGL